MDLKTKLKGSVFYTIYFSIRKKWANRWDVRSKNTLKKDGSAILCELEDILNSYGISHFFDFGTLLGIVRENGIIPGDGDIDIGVIINSNDDKKKIEQLENNKTIRKE